MKPFGRPTILALAVVSAIAGSFAAYAEDLDPLTLFESAKASYGEKKYGQSMSDLKLLFNEIGRRRVDQLRLTLPAAPAGWTAEDQDGDSGALGAMFWGAGVTVKREYKKGDEARVTVELNADSPLVGMMGMMFSNPAMMGEGASVVTIKGKRAVLQYEKEAKRATLQLLLNSNTTLLKVEGSSVSKEDVTNVFGNALDLNAMETALQN